jgi:hypothetical protein
VAPGLFSPGLTKVSPGVNEREDEDLTFLHQINQSVVGMDDEVAVRLSKRLEDGSQFRGVTEKGYLLEDFLLQRVHRVEFVIDFVEDLLQILEG